MRAAAGALGVLFALICAQAALAQSRTIDDFLRDVEAVGEPPFDAARKPEPGYLESYRRAQHELYRKKAVLLLEACQLHPADPRVPDLMNRRWVLLGWNQEPAAVADEVLADIDAVLPKVRDPQVARHAAYWRAHFCAHKKRGDARAMNECIEPFLAAHPGDERGAGLLVLVADDESAGDARRISSFRRLVELHPSSYMAKYAPGLIRQIEGRGKPFELSFEDAVSKKQVSIADLRGKVVVIDFWSTTCGPCVAEMPRMKTLYDEFRSRGVEFIGVSLDEPEAKGGRAAVLEFVQKRRIPWPQYFQGEGFDSAFSKSWGVGGIPAVFVIDKVGRLRSTEARGKLEALLPALVAE